MSSKIQKVQTQEETTAVSGNSIKNTGFSSFFGKFTGVGAMLFQTGSFKQPDFMGNIPKMGAGDLQIQERIVDGQIQTVLTGRPEVLQAALFGIPNDILVGVGLAGASLFAGYKLSSKAIDKIVLRGSLSKDDYKLLSTIFKNSDEVKTLLESSLATMRSSYVSELRGSLAVESTFKPSDFSTEAKLKDAKITESIHKTNAERVRISVELKADELAHDFNSKISALENKLPYEARAQYRKLIGTQMVSSNELVVEIEKYLESKKVTGTPISRSLDLVCKDLNSKLNSMFSHKISNIMKAIESSDAFYPSHLRSVSKIVAFDRYSKAQKSFNKLLLEHFNSMKPNEILTAEVISDLKLDALWGEMNSSQKFAFKNEKALFKSALLNNESILMRSTEVSKASNIRSKVFSNKIAKSIITWTFAALMAYGIYTAADSVYDFGKKIFSPTPIVQSPASNFRDRPASQQNRNQNKEQKISPISSLSPSWKPNLQTRWTLSGNESFLLSPTGINLSAGASYMAIIKGPEMTHNLGISTQKYASAGNPISGAQTGMPEVFLAGEDKTIRVGLGQATPAGASFKEGQDYELTLRISNDGSKWGFTIKTIGGDVISSGERDIPQDQRGVLSSYRFYLCAHERR